MAPILFHGLSQLGLPVVCVESRQAYQALKSLATRKTDRNDARGLAHLARTGFFKPVHVKSLSAHALRSLIIAPRSSGRYGSGQRDSRRALTPQRG
jgi:transposase